MCGSMADIQPATDEIRRGNKKKDRKIEEEERNHRAAIINTESIAYILIAVYDGFKFLYF